MRRLLVFLLLLNLSPESLGSSVEWRSDQDLQLGQVVDPFSHKRLGECPIARMRVQGVTFSSHGRWNLPAKNPFETPDLFSLFDWESSLQRALTLDPVREGAEVYQFSTSVVGPVYQAEYDGPCDMPVGSYQRVDAVVLGSRLEFEIRLRFYDANDKRFWMPKLQLRNTNLFTFFLRLAKVPSHQVEVSLSLRQRGGQISHFLDFQKVNLLNFNRCVGQEWSSCQSLVTHLYSYVYDPKVGLGKQLSTLHFRDQDFFASIQSFRGQRFIAADEQRGQPENSVAEALDYLYQSRSEQIWIQRNSGHDTRRDEIERLQEIGESQFLVTEWGRRCFHTKSGCESTFAHLRQRLSVLREGLSHPFVSKCLKVSEDQLNSFLFAVLKRRLSAGTCYELKSRLQQVDALNLNGGKYVDFLPLTSFKNLKRISIKDSSVASWRGLELLSGLSVLDISDSRTPPVEDLRIMHPDLMIIQ